MQANKSLDSWTIQSCLAYTSLGSNWAVFPLLSLHPEIMLQGSSKTVCASFSIMPATNWLLHSPPRLWHSPSILTDPPDSEGTLRVWDLFYFIEIEGTLRGMLLPWEGAQVLFQFFPSFFFCPTRLCGDYIALSEVWGLLSPFSRYSVRIVTHVNVFLIYLSEEVASMS